MSFFYFHFHLFQWYVEAVKSISNYVNSLWIFKSSIYSWLQMYQVQIGLDNRMNEVWINVPLNDLKFRNDDPIFLQESLGRFSAWLLQTYQSLGGHACTLYKAMWVKLVCNEQCPNLVSSCINFPITHSRSLVSWVTFSPCSFLLPVHYNYKTITSKCNKDCQKAGFTTFTRTVVKDSRWRNWF